MAPTATSTRLEKDRNRNRIHQSDRRRKLGNKRQYLKSQIAYYKDLLNIKEAPNAARKERTTHLPPKEELRHMTMEELTQWKARSYARLKERKGKEEMASMEKELRMLEEMASRFGEDANADSKVEEWQKSKHTPNMEHTSVASFACDAADFQDPLGLKKPSPSRCPQLPLLSTASRPEAPQYPLVRSFRPVRPLRGAANDELLHHDHAGPMCTIRSHSKCTAQVEACGHEGCTKFAHEGGGCLSYGGPVPAATSDALRKSEEEEFVPGMAQSSQPATMEGFTNNAKIGGVGRRHGAKQKFISAMEGGGAAISGKSKGMETTMNVGDGQAVSYDQESLVTSLTSNQVAKNDMEDEEELDSYIWKQSKFAKSLQANNNV
ncbi:hypothetical protein ACHAWF_012141 [Thalassiosira exigua]